LVGHKKLHMTKTII